jgi:hypothetical protein
MPLKGRCRSSVLGPRLAGGPFVVAQPFVDPMLPDGSRLHVVIPDIAYSVRD